MTCASRRTCTGRTWCCSTSTSTATRGAASAPATRLAGPRSPCAASRSKARRGRAPAGRGAGQPGNVEGRPSSMAHVPDSTAEWLEADGLGGFASGTANGVRTRRYHALLLAATTPPTGRMALVNAIEAWLECGGGAEPLTTHRYAPDVLYPDGRRRLEAFEADPWPRWT